MLVKDLIKILETIPQDSIVTVDGYENGNVILKNVEVGYLHHDPNAKDWYPEYWVSCSEYPQGGVPAVNLTRAQYERKINV